jgi:hypothetical protein
VPDREHNKQTAVKDAQVLAGLCPATHYAAPHPTSTTVSEDHP